MSAKWFGKLFKGTSDIFKENIKKIGADLKSGKISKDQALEDLNTMDQILLGIQKSKYQPDADQAKRLRQEIDHYRLKINLKGTL